MIELSEIDKFVISTARGSVGRTNKYRVQIARAFIAKAVLNLGTT
ncbi:hypothetical protein [Thorsellia kenyensis]|uniref:Uncharacterized protein n=1 Tax=Thorsellia kenyensis TaxID=1549888 RepID=A0ABV6C6E0_9GAMM